MIVLILAFRAFLRQLGINQLQVVFNADWGNAICEECH